MTVSTLLSNSRQTRSCTLNVCLGQTHCCLHLWAAPAPIPNWKQDNHDANAHGYKSPTQKCTDAHPSQPDASKLWLYAQPQRLLVSSKVQSNNQCYPACSATPALDSLAQALQNAVVWCVRALGRCFLLELVLPVTSSLVVGLLGLNMLSLLLADARYAVSCQKVVFSMQHLLRNMPVSRFSSNLMAAWRSSLESLLGPPSLS